jgi:HTH-type transcriptional regulator/antitoxin HipB
VRGYCLGMTLKDTLRTARERKGWTQDELAAQAGVGQQTISRLEAGIGDPKLTTLARLEAALGLRSGALAKAAAEGQ